VSGALVVFAREPVPGRVKTRLCPPFAPEQAAAFYACLLDDVLDATARAAPPLGLVPVLAVDPPDACARLALRAPAPFRVVPQHAGDLGARMEAAAADAFARGHAPVLLRGSDSPALGPRRIAAALRALERADLVLLPDRDGGYSLVGLRRPAPGLFAHPMSTPEVLRETLARARDLALESALLETGFDVDTADDLRWLAQARGRDPDLDCPRALAWLDRSALWPPGLRAPEQ
jgi:rSAM/selenodomain-associated transferase 1